jgi:hypothetical protein
MLRQKVLVLLGIVVLLGLLHLGEQRYLSASTSVSLLHEPDEATPESNQTSVVAPAWDIDGEDRKQGAGLLFFAYGEAKTLGHFLAQATAAAASFRAHNPAITIAIVSNNASVDWAVFDLHIVPRTDLLLQGSVGRADQHSRQWFTRLYYLAHTPFQITMALDSNVVSCTPGAAQAFLDAAVQTELWGYHIAHGSQHVLPRRIVPHNWNLAYHWSELTSALLREWLMLQLRQGAAADDQVAARQP